MQSIESNVSNFKVDPLFNRKPVKLLNKLDWWVLNTTRAKRLWAIWSTEMLLLLSFLLLLSQSI